MAGVETEALRAAFGGRDLARVMPTTAAAIGQGTASIYSASPAGRARARLLFEPLGVVVDLEDEALMHAATAVSGSGPRLSLRLHRGPGIGGDRRRTEPRHGAAIGGLYGHRRRRTSGRRR